MSRRCPYCQQVLPEYRLGVQLPPLKARIYDLVLRGGCEGIAADDLLALTYNGNMPNGKGIRAGQRNRKTIGTHINQINDLIHDAGYRIIGQRAGNIPGNYRLERIGRK